MKTKTIHFEDNGQDFLRWTISPEGLVTDCHPCQASVWCGAFIVNAATLRKGSWVRMQTKFGDTFTLKHRVERVETHKRRIDGVVTLPAA